MCGACPHPQIEGFIPVFILLDFLQRSAWLITASTWKQSLSWTQRHQCLLFVFCPVPGSLLCMLVHRLSLCILSPHPTLCPRPSHPPPILTPVIIASIYSGLVVSFKLPHLTFQITRKMEPLSPHFLISQKYLSLISKILGTIDLHIFSFFKWEGKCSPLLLQCG